MEKSFNPPTVNCRRCPRLVGFLEENRRLYPDFHNAPVDSFGKESARILIVGLAPGLKGANRTGRPFTGDFAGDVLYPALLRRNLAQGTYKAHRDDGLVLNDVRITNAVRCVPPQNKVTSFETKTCGNFLKQEMSNMPNLKVVFALGSVAHGAVLSALEAKKSLYPFAHATLHRLTFNNRPLVLVDSYHTSRYNINPGKLPEKMFEHALDVLEQALY